MFSIGFVGDFVQFAGPATLVFEKIAVSSNRRSPKSSILPSGYLTYGKSLINGGFNGKIIYKWAIFHGYVK